MHVMRFEQIIPTSLSESWSFFSSPHNLKLLTPEYLGFEISLDHVPMYAGQIVIHTIKPLWKIPIQWVTEITHVHAPHYFIDEQRLGPYKFWHHEHRFSETTEGVKIVDIIHYELHFGILGNIAHAIKIKQDLQKIFIYRQKMLEKIFKTS